jgi:HAD superfamily hydrolase (TIGR01509 family)
MGFEGSIMAGAADQTRAFLWLRTGPIRVSLRTLMRLKIPDGNFSGYIFDLDGTLVDTMPLHYLAWEAALLKAGMKGRLDENLFYELGGMPSRKVAGMLGRRHGLELDPERVYLDKEAIFMSSLQKLALIEPVVEFARKASRTHPVAVASGGTRDVVTNTLEMTGLAPLFPIVVTADDVEHGKPAPDMFLLAARLMDVEPVHCLVFEDGQLGIQAADAAGMKWVHIPSRPSV